MTTRGTPTDPRAVIAELLTAYQRRSRAQTLTLAGLGAACVAALIWRLRAAGVSWCWPVIAGAVGVAGFVWWWCRAARRKVRVDPAAPLQLDRALKLEGRLVTAAEFAQVEHPPLLYPALVRDPALSLSDASQHLPKTVDRRTCALAAVLLVLLLWPGHHSPLQRLLARTPITPPIQPPPQDQPPQPQQSQQQDQPRPGQPGAQSQQSGAGQSGQSNHSQGSRQPQSPQDGQQSPPSAGQQGSSQNQQKNPQNGQGGGQPRPESDAAGRGQQQNPSSGSPQQGQPQQSPQSQSGQGAPQQHAQQPRAGEGSKPQPASQPPRGQEQARGQPQGQSDKAQSASSKTGDAEQSSAQRQASGRQSAQQSNNADQSGQGQRQRGQQQAAASSEETKAGQSGGSKPTATPGQAELRGDIQQLLKDMSAELKALQAQLSVEQQKQLQQPSSPGTATDPNLYGDASPLEPAHGSQVPIQLNTDTQATSSARRGGGVGQSSGRASDASPQQRAENVGLAEQGAPEQGLQRQSIPPEYRPVFEKLSQEPKGQR